jgi:hypothetical protein
MQSEDEYRRLSIRPSKTLSAAGVGMLAFMLLFGIAFTIVVANVLYENEAPIGLTILVFIFMIGWLGTALFMLIYNIQNLKRAKGVPLIEVDMPEGNSEGTAERDASGGPRRP